MDGRKTEKRATSSGARASIGHDTGKSDRKTRKKKTITGRLLCEISKAELLQHTGLPLRQAASQLGIGCTSLKRLCRIHGIARWPYRRRAEKPQVERRAQRQPFTQTPADSHTSKQRTQSHSSNSLDASVDAETSNPVEVFKVTSLPPLEREQLLKCADDLLEKSNQLKQVYGFTILDEKVVQALIKTLNNVSRVSA